MCCLDLVRWTLEFHCVACLTSMSILLEGRWKCYVTYLFPPSKMNRKFVYPLSAGFISGTKFHCFNYFVLVSACLFTTIRASFFVSCQIVFTLIKILHSQRFEFTFVKI